MLRKKGRILFLSHKRHNSCWPWFKKSVKQWIVWLGNHNMMIPFNSTFSTFQQNWHQMHARQVLPNRTFPCGFLGTKCSRIHWRKIVALIWAYFLLVTKTELGVRLSSHPFFLFFPFTITAGGQNLPSANSLVSFLFKWRPVSSMFKTFAGLQKKQKKFFPSLFPTK